APVPPRCPFPTRHPLWQGVLPPSIAGVSAQLTGHDLVLALGAPIFRYHVYAPGPWLPPGAELIAVVADPQEAARAAFGDAVVAQVGVVVEQLLAHLPARDGEAQPATRAPAEAGPLPAAQAAPFRAEAVFVELARHVPVEV